MIMCEQMGLSWLDRFIPIGDLGALIDVVEYIDDVNNEAEVYAEYALYADEMED